MDDFSQFVSSWETYYLLSGTAAATLIGLLFVAISVGQESFRARASTHLQLFGGLTFNSFFYVLLISILFLIPGMNEWGLGLPLLFLGLSALIGAVLQHRQARRIPSHRFGTDVARRFYVPMICLAGVTVIGGLVLFHVWQSLYGLVAVVIFLLASASQNAWALLTQSP